MLAVAVADPSSVTPKPANDTEAPPTRPATRNRKEDSKTSPAPAGVTPEKQARPSEGVHKNVAGRNARRKSRGRLVCEIAEY